MEVVEEKNETTKVLTKVSFWRQMLCRLKFGVFGLTGRSGYFLSPLKP